MNCGKEKILEQYENKLTFTYDVEIAGKLPNFCKIKYYYNFDRDKLKEFILSKDRSLIYKTDELRFYDEIEKREKFYYLELSKKKFKWERGMSQFMIKLKFGQNEYSRYKSGYPRRTWFKYKIELIFDEMITKWTDCVLVDGMDKQFILYPPICYRRSCSLIQYYSLDRFISTLKLIKLDFQRVAL